VEKTVIKTSAPPSGAPLNTAVRFGQLLFISGIPPFTEDFASKLREARAKEQSLPTFPEMPFEQQAEIVMDRLREIVEAAGSTMDHLLKVNVWLKSQSDQATFDRIYRPYFRSPETMPARTRMQTGATPMGCGLEVEAIGYIPEP